MTAPGPAGPPASYPGPDGPAPQSGVPAPPPGPGAAPPFAAPPTEGRTMRMWIGLGVAALAVLLCCGGGTAAVIGLAVSGTEAINEQARAVVGDYLDAVIHDDFGKAYDLLCVDAQRRESPPEFERRVSAEPKIAAYQVGNVSVSDLVVPVDITYAGGNQDNLRASLDQDTQTGGLKVCGIN